MRKTSRGLIRYIANRLVEPTTWAGIIISMQEAGAFVSPEHAATIRTIGIALASIVVVLMKEGRAND